MPQLETSGTQSLTVGTEHTLATITTEGTYQLVLDLNAIVGGATPDIVEVRVKGKCLTGGTLRQEEVVTYVGGLIGSPLVRSIPYPSDIEIVFTIKQIQGTGRNVP